MTIDVWSQINASTRGLGSSIDCFICGPKFIADYVTYTGTPMTLDEALEWLIDNPNVEDHGDGMFTVWMPGKRPARA